MEVTIVYNRLWFVHANGKLDKTYTVRDGPNGARARKAALREQGVTAHISSSLVDYQPAVRDRHS